MVTCDRVQYDDEDEEKMIELSICREIIQLWICRKMIELWICNEMIKLWICRQIKLMIELWMCSEIRELWICSEMRALWTQYYVKPCRVVEVFNYANDSTYVNAWCCEVVVNHANVFELCIWTEWIIQVLGNYANALN